MRGVFTFCTLVAAVIFPWPLTALLVLSMTSLEPLLPLAAGIIYDSLYFTPHTYAFPLATVYGAGVALFASVVHSRLRKGSH